MPARRRVCRRRRGRRRLPDAALARVEDESHAATVSEPAVRRPASRGGLLLVRHRDRAGDRSARARQRTFGPLVLAAPALRQQPEAAFEDFVDGDVRAAAHAAGLGGVRRPSRPAPRHRLGSSHRFEPPGVSCEPGADPVRERRQLDRMRGGGDAEGSDLVRRSGREPRAVPRATCRGASRFRGIQGSAPGSRTGNHGPVTGSVTSRDVFGVPSSQGVQRRNRIRRSTPVSGAAPCYRRFLDAHPSGGREQRHRGGSNPRDRTVARSAALGLLFVRRPRVAARERPSRSRSRTPGSR